MYIQRMSYDSAVTVKGKGGRPKVLETRKGDPAKLRPVILYESQWVWLKRQPGGAAVYLRSVIDRAMKRRK
jgi:hypothetical protein